MPTKTDQLNDALKPVVISSLSDIKAVLSGILNDKLERNTVTFDCKLPWHTDSESGEDKLKGYSYDTSLYKLLIDGFDMVKRQVEAAAKINELYLKAKEADPSIGDNMRVWDVTNMRFNVDSLIQKRLGGKRHGLRIRWAIKEGQFEFDPYTRKLFKVENE